MTKGVTVALGELRSLVAEVGTARRLVAIAGALGSGKSTLTDDLVTHLNVTRPGVAAVLPMDGYHFDDRVLVDTTRSLTPGPMDGYHFDDRVLVPRGLRSRKGAPETFDVVGLQHMLKRVRNDNEEEVAVPVFDRDLEIARAAARLIPRSARIIIIDGNYLLLDCKPWSDLHVWFDTTIMVRVPVEDFRQRLTARWEGYGLSAD